MIREISISSIVPNSFNPNKMPKGTLNKLKKSIEKLGLLNPIIVREKDDKYEIIDGEWRWRAYKELGMQNIFCNVITATDEDVKKIIFASTIKGKHNAFESQEVLKGFLDGADSDDLLGCNLDRSKLERKTKYIKFTKGTALNKGREEKHLVDESTGLPSIEEYQIILAIPLEKDDYEKAINKLNNIDKNISIAFMKLIND